MAYRFEELRVQAPRSASKCGDRRLSYPYELGGETLWDAGYFSGKLYASLARGAAEFVELPTGLTPTPQGSCDVELPTFRAFVQGLYAHYSSTSNPVIHGLARGLLVTSLVLLEHAGAPITLKPEHEEALKEEKTAFARSMGQGMRPEPQPTAGGEHRRQGVRCGER